MSPNDEHEFLHYDFDGDGRDDLVFSGGHFDGNGIPHSLDIKFDADGDGRADGDLHLASAPGELLPNSVKLTVDLNHDGHPEIVLKESDTNRDGTLDRTDLRLDIDSDGKSDFSVAGLDVTGDGLPDVPLPESWADALWGSSPGAPAFAGEDNFLPLMHEHPEVDYASVTSYSELHGTASEDRALWDEQDTPNSCAVATTNMMFRSIGIDVGEGELAEIFGAYGIYDPMAGTNPKLIDDVLNDVAARNSLNFHATEINAFDASTLEEMTNAGIRPLIALDSELLYADKMELPLIEASRWFGVPGCGHAVQLTSIVHENDADFAVINDPGFPDGAGVTIPLDRFMEASAAFGYEAVALTT